MEADLLPEILNTTDYSVLPEIDENDEEPQVAVGADQEPDPAKRSKAQRLRGIFQVTNLQDKILEK